MGESGTGQNYWSRFAARRVNRRGALKGGALLSGAAALGLAGCSSSTNNSSSNSATATKAASTVATITSGTPARPATSPAPSGTARPGTPAAAAPGAKAAPTANAALKTGGTINEIFVVANVPLDPFANTTYTSQDIVGFVYSRLFRFNSGADPNITLSRDPVPDLVESYQVPDASTFVMKLRQNATFHAPLSRAATSADVTASIDRFRNEPKNANKGIFDPIIDSITAPDASTIQFKLKQPYSPFLNKLANPQYLWMMSQDAASNKIDPSQQLIGTGPWMWSGSTPTTYSYKKNPNYFIKGVPYADGVVLNVIPAVATQESQFIDGKLDILGIPAADVDSVKKAVPKATVTEYVGNLLSFLFFSDVTQDSIFKDDRVRQAASLAIDRTGFLDLIYGKQGAWDNLINPGLGKWWLDPQSAAAGDSAQYFKHDIQKAKQLLAAAGYTGQLVQYFYPNDAYGDLYNQAADAVRGMLSDAGFKLQVNTVSYLKDWIEPTKGYYIKGLPANSMGYGLQTPFTEPDDYFSQMLVAGSPRNNSKVNDPAIEAMVKAQQKELDDTKRLQQVYDIQKAHAAKMYYVPMANGKTFAFTQAWTQNYWVADDYGFGTEGRAYMSVNNK